MPEAPASAVLAALERLLLPAECVVCARPVPEHEPDQAVCGGCLVRMRPVNPPWCDRCGQPRPLFGPCRLCAGWPPAFRQCRSAVWLDQGARRAVHAFKYDGMRRLAAPLALRLAQLVTRPPGASVLVPIPLAAGRLRARGYNQSELLARALAKHWNLRVDAARLSRRRETETQTALTPEARVANVAGAFYPEPRSGEGSAVVLVDDVFTTGATLAEAARALCAGGATDVIAVTFGRAIIPDFR